MDQDYVRDLARLIVADADPEQVRAFETHADAYFEDPRRALAGVRAGHDPMGNGLAIVASDLVPLSLAVAEHLLEAVRFAGDHVVSAALEVAFGETTRETWKVWRKRRRQARPEADIAEDASARTEPARPFDPRAVFAAYGEDLSRVHEAALAGATANGAGPEQRRKIATSTVAVFAVLLKEPPTLSDPSSEPSSK